MRESNAGICLDGTVSDARGAVKVLLASAIVASLGCFESAGPVYHREVQETEDPIEGSVVEDADRSDSADADLGRELEELEPDEELLGEVRSERRDHDGEAACPAGTMDCDHDPSNGCETDVTNDPLNCGGCGKSCAGKFPHAEAECLQGKCIQGECDTGYVDLDPEVAGCEYECTPSPSGQEVCNGLDDDCDGLVDGVCGPGQECLDGSRCEPGLLCTSDLFETETDGTCTRMCYSSYHACPDGFWCNVLARADSMGYCEQGGGDGLLGETCSTWADCGSTWCLERQGGGRFCSDKCSSNSQCGMEADGLGLVCSLFGVSFREGRMFTGLCVPPKEQGGLDGEPCDIDRPCRSGMCLEYSPGDPRCRSICCSSSECETGNACRLALSSAPDFPAAFVRACVPVDDTGIGGTVRGKGGAPCIFDRDCASRVCDRSMGSRCLDLCCTDADCSEDTICTPALVDEKGESMGMLCLPLEDGSQPAWGVAGPDKARLKELFVRRVTVLLSNATLIQR